MNARAFFFFFLIFTQFEMADVDESQDSSSSEDEDIFELCKYEKNPSALASITALIAQKVRTL